MKSSNASRLIGYSAVSWFGALLGIIVIPIATRIFDQSDLGKINLYISAATIIYTIVLLGLDQGFIRFFYDCESDSEKSLLYRRCITTSICASLVFILLVCVFWNELTIFLVGTPSIYIAFCLIITVLSLLILRFSTSYWRAAERLKKYSLFAILSIVLMKLSYFGGLISNATYISGITSVTIFGSICILLCILSSIRLTANSNCAFSSFRFLNVIVYSIPLLPATLLSTANAYLPAYFLRVVGNFDEVGIYTMAVTLASCVSVFSSGVNAFWPPYVFKNYQTKQSTIQLFHRAIVLSITFVVVLIMIFKDYFLMILGPGYSEASSFLPMLLIVPFCYTIGETAGIGIHISKKSQLLLISYAAGLVINVITGLFLVSSLGMLGAAISATSCSITILLCKSYFGEREYKSIKSWKHMLASLLIVIALSVFSAIGLSGYLYSLICIFGFLLLIPVFGIKDIKTIVSYIYNNIISAFRRNS